MVESTPDPLEILARAVGSYHRYMDDDGELHDPLFGEPTQYGTAYHALGNAVLARFSDGLRRRDYAAKARSGLRAALDHVLDTAQPPTASTFERDVGTVSRVNHRDFFWPPIVRTYTLLRDLAEQPAPDLGTRLGEVDIRRSFSSMPPSNWAAVWLCGEWLRLKAGLSPHSEHEIDDWIGAYFAGAVRIDLGLFLEPGLPNSYDLFLRYHFADLMANGYRGRWSDAMGALMETGLRRSLDVQLSDGSLASAHRSSGQTWTLGAQCAYFTHAAQYFRGRDDRREQNASAAAGRALASFARWQRDSGPYSPVENCLPPGYRIGYESYTADGHYGNLAAGLLAVAVDSGQRQAAAGPLEHPQPRVRVEAEPVSRVLAHHGDYSVHVNADPAPGYDAFGIVDLTFGLGRYFHFVSSVAHVESGRLYSLGLAHRAEAGRSQLRVISHDLPRLVGEIEQGPGTAFRLSCVAKGASYSLGGAVERAHDAATMPGLVVDLYHYTLGVTADAGGVHVEEATPGLSNYKTLLVPYLRDAGRGETTAVDWSADRVRFRHGDEEVEVAFNAAIEWVLDLSYGFESRRGLCGLLRVDFRQPREAVSYTVSVVH